VGTEITDELKALQSKAASLSAREVELAAENEKLARENAELRNAAMLSSPPWDAVRDPLGTPMSPFEASPFEKSPFETSAALPMSPTDATLKGSPTPVSAASVFNDELFFEPEKTNSVTDPSVANPFLPESSQGEEVKVANPFLPDSSQGEQGEMMNPFLQNSSHGDGTGAEVRSTDAHEDLIDRTKTMLDVPEDRPAEIAELVARLIASLIMNAVVSVSNELDKAFNDEVSNEFSNEGDKLMSTAKMTAEPSSLLLTATEEMSPAQAVLDGEDEDPYGGLNLARRSITGVIGAPKPDVSGLDLESYDEEFEGDSP
jgi:hypothetical protein